MDLSVIKEALGNLTTFLKAVPELFKGLPDLFHLLGEWFSKDGDKLGIEKAWDTTAGIFPAAEPKA